MLWMFNYGPLISVICPLYKGYPESIQAFMVGFSLDNPCICNFVGEITKFAKGLYWLWLSYTTQQIVFMKFPLALQIEPYTMDSKVLALEELK